MILQIPAVSLGSLGLAGLWERVEDCEALERAREVYRRW